MTPPCGLPREVSSTVFPSMTPAVNHPLIRCRIRGNVASFSRSGSCAMLSKHPAISASRTYLSFLQVASKIAAIASCAERAGRKP